MPILRFDELSMRSILRKFQKQQELSIKHSKFLQFKFCKNDLIIKQKNM